MRCDTGYRKNLREYKHTRKDPVHPQNLDNSAECCAVPSPQLILGRSAPYFWVLCSSQCLCYWSDHISEEWSEVRFLSLSTCLQLGIQLLCLTKYCPYLTSQKYEGAYLSTYSSIRGMTALSFPRKGTSVFTERQTDVSFTCLRHQDMELTGQTPNEVISRNDKISF